jgi:predicted amidophosphoribosyltransferase
MQLLDLLFPKFCLNCNSPGSYLCPTCVTLITRHKQICIICGRISPYGQTHDRCQPHTNLDGIIIATEYKNLMKKLIHKIKYGLSYAILDELLTKTLVSKKIKTCLEQEQITLCTAIPMHPQKFNQRGFNQSELIAKWVEKNYKIPYKQLLIKTKSTTPQMQLHRTDRLFNQAGAFTTVLPLIRGS